MNEMMQEQTNTMNKNNTFKNTLIAVIIIGVIVVFVAIFTVSAVTNNNKKNTAIQRIENLIDGVISAKISNNYDASQKLKEAKSLIEEYSLGEEFDKKYSDAEKYVNDSKVYNEVVQSLYNFDNTKASFIKINQQFASLSSERVLSYLDGDTGTMYLSQLGSIAEKYIAANAIYKMQQKFKQEQPDSMILETIHFTTSPYKSTKPDSEQFFMESGLGIKGYLSSESKISELEQINTWVVKESVFNIDEKNNGHAFLIVYRDPKHDSDMYSRSRNDYSRTSCWYYYVGFDIEAFFSEDNSVTYKLTEYKDGKETSSWLSAEEVVRYSILNP